MRKTVLVAGLGRDLVQELEQGLDADVRCVPIEKLRLKWDRAPHAVVLGGEILRMWPAAVARDALQSVRDRVFLCTASVEVTALRDWLAQGVGRLASAGSLVDAVSESLRRESRPQLRPEEWLPRGAPESPAALAVASLVPTLPRLDVDSWAAAWGHGRRALQLFCRAQLGDTPKRLLDCFVHRASAELRGRGATMEESAHVLGLDVKTLKRAIGRAERAAARRARPAK
jgi:hypothetical protein